MLCRIRQHCLCVTLRALTYSLVLFHFIHSPSPTLRLTFAMYVCVLVSVFICVGVSVYVWVWVQVNPGVLVALRFKSHEVRPSSNTLTANVFTDGDMVPLCDILMELPAEVKHITHLDFSGCSWLRSHGAIALSHALRKVFSPLLSAYLTSFIPSVNFDVIAFYRCNCLFFLPSLLMCPYSRW